MRYWKYYAFGAILLVFAFLIANSYSNYTVDFNKSTTAEGRCTAASDCEKQNLVHIMCTGGWVCAENRCGWVCGEQVNTTEKGGLNGATVECYEDGHCPAGVCPDNSTYKRYSCLNYKCTDINYFADPCKYR